MAMEANANGAYNIASGRDTTFNEIMDVYAFRIVVDKVDTCYRVLGAVHNLYKPLPGRWESTLKLESIDMPGMPPEAKAISPGRDLARASSSATVLKGCEGAATTTLGMVPIRATGARSCSGS